MMSAGHPNKGVGGRTGPRRSPPGLSEDMYRKVLVAEAGVPKQAATHYAIAKLLRDRGLLDMPQDEAQALVREWRSWPRHVMFARHWRAWSGTL
jgi:hypothetical protein